MKFPSSASTTGVRSYSHPDAAYSAVQMTSIPSTSHSLDSARSRWICCSRWMSAFSGSSSRSASNFGFCSLKVSTAVLKAPLVSLPMHQVTLPDASLASEGCSVFASDPPPPSPPPPQELRPRAATHSPKAIRYLTMSPLVKGRSLPRVAVPCGSITHGGPAPNRHPDGFRQFFARAPLRTGASGYVRDSPRWGHQGLP